MTDSDQARLAILISGRGSNLQAFIDACDRDELNAGIRLVISNNPGAPGLQRARDVGVETCCIDHRDFDSREAFDQALVNRLVDCGADLVILAGFMRILTPVFIQPFTGRLLNIHPSLLPKYRGLHTHRRALEAGDAEAGVTVHFVTPELDGGPPILQASVAIAPGDNEESLAAKVIVQEHIIYPIAARWHLEGRLQLTEEGAWLDGERIPATGIQLESGLT